LYFMGRTPRIINLLRKNCVDSDSDDRKILTGFVWVSIFVFIGKLAGAAKEMAIAWRFGISDTVDAYVFVFSLVNWPVSIWFSVLTVVLVPIVARLQYNSPNELQRFRSELLGLALVVSLLLIALFWLGLPYLLQATWVGLSDQTASEALNMSIGLGWLGPIGVLISLFSAWMLACGRHRNTLFEAIRAVVILVALLLPLGHMSDVLLWSTVIGVALHMIALAAPMQRRGELNLPTFRFTSSAWQGFWRGAGIMAIGQVLMSVTNIIDQVFAAGVGPGALSTLSYANRILALIMGMAALAIGRATLPVFSAAYAKNDPNLNALAMRWARWMFFIGICVAILGAFLAPWVVRILFERGAFSASDTLNVANIFRYSLLQIPLYAFGLTLVNLFASQKKYIILLISGALGLIVKCISTMLLVPNFGLEGLMISSAIVYFINACFFILCFFRKRNG
jgi:peptidoglycan biosynthesis protein MviN/MurJ (putative lipid II flippase)